MWDAMVYSNNKKFLMGKFNSFCVGIPHTLSAPAVFFSLFICMREPSVCHMVSIRKGEDPGNECL